MFLHYDMDAFFASIEKRDNPNLKDKPVVIGKSIVSTASYEARKYGIKSTMIIHNAQSKCKNLVIINPRVEYYHKVGNEIREYIARFFLVTDYISCDEGFVDISKVLEKRFLKYNIKSDKDKIKEILNFAKLFKQKLEKKFNLPLSVGIGETKNIAKIATEVDKPNGIHLFYNQIEFIDYVIDKKIGIFHGIGKKTISLLMGLGIQTTRDLLKKDKISLIKLLGNSRGSDVYNIIRGNYRSENNNRVHDKSIAKERTYFKGLNNLDDILHELKSFSNILASKLKEEQKYTRTVSVKIRYSDRSIITKSKTFEKKLKTEDEIFEKSKNILYTIDKKDDIRLLGISLSNFSDTDYEYIKLFELE
ncbi:Y-family DNA polymerase [Oceanivirga salmonicida]|uniref:Y-family DNA polymerase n=1 Tax=Oceanivirga salmonicida TaxID=1769291 RepID=UPI00083414B5|nr:DNA polymerase IV [Oceanivirga salmonicida]